MKLYDQGGAIETALICSALLFDLDGVLVDSRRAVELSWERWAEARGVHNEFLMKLAHGRRTSESLPEIAPHLDVATEVAFLEKIESEETRGLFPIAGAHALLQSLPSDRWAIVTSGSDKVALSRMRHCGIPKPDVFITALDVQTGKPAPDGYLAAAAKLGVPPEECVVVEDTRAGIASGKAGGMKVVAVEGTENLADLVKADVVAKKLSDIRVERLAEGRMKLLVVGEQG